MRAMILDHLCTDDATVRPDERNHFIIISKIYQKQTKTLPILLSQTIFTWVALICTNNKSSSTTVSTKVLHSVESVSTRARDKQIFLQIFFNQ
jgi:hypothetical protein